MNGQFNINQTINTLSNTTNVIQQGINRLHQLSDHPWLKESLPTAINNIQLELNPIKAKLQTILADYELENADFLKEVTKLTDEFVAELKKVEDVSNFAKSCKDCKDCNCKEGK